jgi:hypothetical protein
MGNHHFLNEMAMLGYPEFLKDQDLGVRIEITIAMEESTLG